MSEQINDLYQVLGEIAQAALDRPGSDPRAVAEKGIKAIRTPVLRELAVRAVIRNIEIVRRAEARRVEELAVRTTEPSRRSEPGPAVSDEPVTAENWMAIRDPRHHGNAPERRHWRKQMGERFDDWHRYASEYIEANWQDEDKRELFAEDWHLDGVRGRQREVAYRRLRVYIDEMAESIRLDVTEELLGSYFALGDGRRVTWGLATVEDHQARIAMLAAQAAGATETAARHAAAINMLKEGGATCLAEMRDDQQQAA